MDHSSSHKNPSREVCEAQIKRILMTEVLEHGTNKTFRFASDFMKYFESLYPASPGLTKQVQRAVKSLNMPKDEKGYFIVNKTSAQLDQDKEIARVLQANQIQIAATGNTEFIFLPVADTVRNYLLQLITQSETFRGKYLTVLETSNGLLILTENKNQLTMLINSLTI